MVWFKYFRSWFEMYRRTWNGPDSDSKKISCLPELPLELLLLIVNDLAAVDRACLALCNTVLAYKLQRYITDLRSKENPDRCDLLSRLSWDHPQLLLCREHSILHRWNQSIGPPRLEHTNLPWCVSIAREGLFASLIVNRVPPTYRLTFQHLRRAIERDLYGANRGIPLDALSWLELRTSDLEGITVFSSVEAQVVCGELHLRIQQWELLRWDVAEALLREPHSICFSAPKTCIHARSFQCHNPRLGRCGIECIEPSIAGLTHPSHLHCPVCGVDSQLVLKRYGDQSLAIVVTKWLNLGSGKYLSDWKWRRHFTYRLESGSMADTAAETTVREVFQQKYPKTLENLTTENELMVYNGQYRNRFDPYLAFASMRSDIKNQVVWIRYAYRLKDSLPDNYECQHGWPRIICLDCLTK